MSEEIQEVAAPSYLLPFFRICKAGRAESIFSIASGSFTGTSPSLAEGLIPLDFAQKQSITHPLCQLCFGGAGEGVEEVVSVIIS